MAQHKTLGCMTFNWSWAEQNNRKTLITNWKFIDISFLFVCVSLCPQPLSKNKLLKLKNPYTLPSICNAHYLPSTSSLPPTSHLASHYLPSTHLSSNYLASTYSLSPISHLPSSYLPSTCTSHLPTSHLPVPPIYLYLHLPTSHLASQYVSSRSLLSAPYFLSSCLLPSIEILSTSIPPSSLLPKSTPVP